MVKVPGDGFGDPWDQQSPPEERVQTQFQALYGHRAISALPAPKRFTASANAVLTSVEKATVPQIVHIMVCVCVSSNTGYR